MIFQKALIDFKKSAFTVSLSSRVLNTQPCKITKGRVLGREQAGLPRDLVVISAALRRLHFLAGCLIAVPSNWKKIIIKLRGNDGSISYG